MSNGTLGWISVEERLPEHSIKVLCANPVVWGRRVVTGMLDSAGLWTGSYCSEMGDDALPPNDPTYWMPLPEPPKVDGTRERTWAGQ